MAEADDPDRTGISGLATRRSAELSYIRVQYARLESNQRPPPSHGGARPLSFGRPEPPAGIEPTLRPYEGRVLAVDTTEA